jgi:Mn-dependent DtxR family transcriptional regulator
MTDGMEEFYNYIQTHPNANRKKIANDLFRTERFVTAMVTTLRRSGYISSEQANKIFDREDVN